MSWRGYESSSRRAIGHSGTLDPMATGVLVMALEQARTLQVPPAFSTTKQDGKPSHARARRGEHRDPVLRWVVTVTMLCSHAPSAASAETPVVDATIRAQQLFDRVNGKSITCTFDVTYARQ
jgi:tRNA U55 pseudouridine synthase TruB